MSSLESRFIQVPVLFRKNKFYISEYELRSLTSKISYPSMTGTIWATFCVETEEGSREYKTITFSDAEFDSFVHSALDQINYYMHRINHVRSEKMKAKGKQSKQKVIRYKVYVCDEYIGDLFPLKDTRIERADIDEETE
ncbi:hypothetical protein [Bacillus phage SBSphiJ3]|nr:hypothetical protein [Bacillus phage SBSphiJ3]